MKIKLIAPLTQSGLLGMRIPLGIFNKRYGGAPLALPTLASLTPSGVELVLTDENVEAINFDEEVDLVGITFNVAGVSRAYEIADKFRRKAVPVVLGGIYVSMLPEEALNHADAIVVGEAEKIWEQLLEDFSQGKLQKVYRAEQSADLQKTIIPRWDLLKTTSYNYFSLQTTRGCPFNCDFCSVTYIFGGTYRYKPVENVINEIKFIKNIDKKKLIFFVDDNIVSNREYAKKLFEAIIPMNIRWYSQTPITVANDEEMLKLMREAGCKELFIGLESLSQDSLEILGKGKINKVAEYEKAIEKIYSHDISVFASFMLGCEYDDETIFEKTIQFINSNHIPFSLINILVPPPGTRLFKRLEEEKRIMHKDWSKYTGEYVTFIPRKMKPELLQEGFYTTLKEVYSYTNIYNRLNQLWRKGLLISKAKAFGRGFYKLGTIIIAIISFLIRGKFGNLLFFLRCVLNPENPLLTPIFLSISLHEYTSNLIKKKVNV